MNHTKRSIVGKIYSMQSVKFAVLGVMVILALSGCLSSLASPASVVIEPTGWLPIIDIATALHKATEIPIEITPTPTPTSGPIRVNATVWREMPQVPILMYHRFNPRSGERSATYMTTLSDFDVHLNRLYEAGFSLIALQDWLRGEIHLQPGRRPLIITIDDLYYGDQLSLDDHGHPAAYSGVGHLWAFSQKHPDFNFHAALFYNLGDKGYFNHYQNGTFSVQPGWREDRARAIAWGIRHGATPMNHFYEHPFLDRLSPAQIQWQLSENDTQLREALASIGKESLAAGLPNILALPYVVWPSTPAGTQVLYDYVSPEGAPVAAILEAGFGPRLFPAPFSPEHDPFRVPRANASFAAIDYILSQIDQIPPADHCDLGELPGELAFQAGPVMTRIEETTEIGRCPHGYYIVGQMAFHASENGIIQLSP